MYSLRELVPPIKNFYYYRCFYISAARFCITRVYNQNISALRGIKLTRFFPASRNKITLAIQCRAFSLYISLPFLLSARYFNLYIYSPIELIFFSSILYAKVLFELYFLSQFFNLVIIMLLSISFAIQNFAKIKICAP